jgi:hypothetical protein
MKCLNDRIPIEVFAHDGLLKLPFLFHYPQRIRVAYSKAFCDYFQHFVDQIVYKNRGKVMITTPKPNVYFVSLLNFMVSEFG